jgi:hypothetical protein
MKAASNRKPDDEFIASARRAFRRVTRTLRAENARFGLPSFTGEVERLTKHDPRSGSTSTGVSKDETGSSQDRVPFLEAVERAPRLRHKATQ